MRTVRALTLPIVMGAAGMVNASEARTWIETHRHGDRITVMAHAESAIATQLRYELRIERIGDTNRNHTRQAGTFTLEANSPRRLSQVTLTQSEPIRYRVDLTIYREDQPIAHAEKTVP